MTVAELIRELQAMPQHMSVRVVPSLVYDQQGGDEDAREIHLDDTDATEADEVRHMGPWVLIRGK